MNPFRHPVLSIPIACVLAFFFVASCKEEDTFKSSDSTTRAIIREYVREPIKVRIILDKDNITVAENLDLTIQAEVKEGYDVRLPAFGEKLGQFGILDYHERPPELLAEGRIFTEKTCQLEPFLSGDYKIAPMKVTFWPKSSGGENKEPPRQYEIETEEILIKVKSLLGEERNRLQINPIFGPLALPHEPLPRLYLVFGVCVFLLFGGVVVCLWLRHRRRQVIEVVATLPAHELALRQLQEIINENLLDQGKFKLFYFRISDAMRYYIENRFGLHAPERTTEEFLAEIGLDSSFSSEHQRLLDAFLRHCDIVKFAQHRPAPDEIQRTFDACKAFIEATRHEDALVVNSKG